MIISRNAKRRNGVRKLSGNKSKKTTELKANVETKKIIKPKAQKVLNPKPKAAGDDAKGAKVEKNLKPRKKSTFAEDKTVSKSQKKNTSESSKVNTAQNETITHNHGLEITGKAKSPKKELLDNKRFSLKRKLSTKENTVVGTKLKSKPEISNKPAKSGETTKLKKKRKDAKNSQENVENVVLRDLSKQHILQCIGAIFHLTQEQLKRKNALFDGESHPVFMQVTCIRVPKTPRRQMRILLPHSIVAPDDDVALFVCDLERGRRKDYEPTVEYYEELLRKHGCKMIKSVIPMNQVKTEYDQYELKRKLVSSYDRFLVDGRIAGHLSHLLGSHFYKKRRLPTSVRMSSKDLKHEIEHALKKTSMQLHSFGDTHIVQIGHTNMQEEQITENVMAACKVLSKNYPGRWRNIRSIQIKTAISIGLPIYTSLKKKNSVRVPVVHPKRPKAYRDVEGELSTLSANATVIVTPEGDVTVNKKGKKTIPTKKRKMNEKI